MGAVGSPQGGGGKKKGKKRKKKRLGFALDMTPMVDVAFLLLTFFMLTTTFSKPQTMEINLPPKEDFEVKIAESNVLTLRIMEGNKVYWNIGFQPPESFALYDTTGEKPAISKVFDNVINEQREKIRFEAQADAMALVLKFDLKSKYRNIVDVIDELNLMKMTRFSIAAMTDEDRSDILKFESGEPEIPAKGGKN